jgi:hypothetical protein
MENPTSQIQIIGEVPDFGESCDIVFESELSVNSIVHFVRKDAETMVIRLVDLEKIDGFEGLLYRVGRDAETRQIVFEQASVEAVKEAWETQLLLDGLLKRTFNNLIFLYRDADIGDAQSAKYQRGMILQERGFVEASYRRGGFAAKHRYLIASSTALDLSRIPTSDPEHGLMAIIKDSFFRVLDICEKDGFRQTTLLHIPEDLVEFFNAGEELSGPELQIAEAARSDFNECAASEPIAALTSETWLKRVESPVGTSDEGELFFAI